MLTRILTIFALLVVASCQSGGKNKSADDGPNLARKPSGKGWWCMTSPEARISCKRARESCETDRTLMLSRMPEGSDLPSCTEHAEASCLTFRPRNKGNEAPFCLATVERCEATRKQLLNAAKEVGHTRITRCASWE